MFGFLARNKLCSSLILLLTFFLFFLLQFGIDKVVDMFPVIEHIDQKYYILSPTEISLKKEDGPIEEEQIFVRSAFLVSDREIRLTIIKHHKNRYDSNM